MALVPVKRTEMGNLMRLPQRMSSDLLNQIMGQWEPFMGERALWPAIDIADKADAIVIKAEVPGCKSEDIEISIYGSTMTISGEKKEHAEAQKENYYHVESRYGSFRRDLILPAEVDVDKVSAQSKDGILTVTMPKAEKAKAKRIKVQG
jgi:HSP20 family protein